MSKNELKVGHGGYSPDFKSTIVMVRLNLQELDLIIKSLNESKAHIFTYTRTEIISNYLDMMEKEITKLIEKLQNTNKI